MDWRLGNRIQIECFCLSFKVKNFLSTRFRPARLSIYIRQFLAVLRPVL